MTECIIVGIGGFIGAVCRYLIGLIPVSESCPFPIKTFLINITGSFAIGVIATDIFLFCTGNGKSPEKRKRQNRNRLCSTEYGRWNSRRVRRRSHCKIILRIT